jgi:hypothetical protein
MSTAFVTAWITILLTGSGQTLLERQVRVDPIACHLPAVRAEYPIDGRWHAVMLRIRCAQ